jgi:hypothetical protein
MSHAFPSYLQLDALGCTSTFYCIKHANGRISLYHIYCLLRNSTTIEGWEKDKAALMVKKGKLHTVCIRPFFIRFIADFFLSGQVPLREPSAHLVHLHHMTSERRTWE